MPAAGITGQPGGVPTPPAPPLPGRPPEALTPSGRIPLPAQLKAPATKSRIPKFSKDPLRAIAFVLSEAALAFGGQPTNLARLLRLESEDEANAQARGLQRQSLKLRKDAQMFDAIKFGAEQLKGKSGDEADALIATVENVVPEAAEVLRAMAKAGAEKSQALLEMFTENPGIFLGASDVAQALGAEKTMELFGPIAAALNKQKALAPGRVAEAGAIAAAKEAAKPKDQSTDLVDRSGPQAVLRTKTSSQVRAASSPLTKSSLDEVGIV